MTAAGVLFSGGLDSAVLLAAELETSDRVWPIRVHDGLAWNDAENRVANTLLAQTPFVGRTQPLRLVTVDMRDVYPTSHWAVTGSPPAYDTPDEDVYLEGRNIVLIAKAAVLCARLGIGRLVLGPLAGNPFPDATGEFFTSMARSMSLGLGHVLEIAAPFSKLHKPDVIRLGAKLRVPMDLTLSCMNPQGDEHCGRCSKCRERQEAFQEAGVPDSTRYAATWSRA